MKLSETLCVIRRPPVSGSVKFHFLAPRTPVVCLFGVNFQIDIDQIRISRLNILTKIDIYHTEVIVDFLF
jgi:hypothetical protein